MVEIMKIQKMNQTMMEKLDESRSALTKQHINRHLDGRIVQLGISMARQQGQQRRWGDLEDEVGGNEVEDGVELGATIHAGPFGAR